MAKQQEAKKKGPSVRMLAEQEGLDVQGWGDVFFNCFSIDFLFLG